MNNNEINVSLLISTNSESIPFPVDSDPSLKTDFENEGRLMVIFANPLSGSQEGLTIMELGGQYRSSTVNKYMVLKFPDCSSNVANETAKTMVSTSSNLREKSYRPAVFDPSITFSIVVFNILDKADFTKGKKFIKEYLNRYENNKIKILIGGGDGTVLSIVEDLNEDKVNLERCIFGAVPLGTGNDLSNAMGFGNRVNLNKKISHFHRVLYTYLMAEQCKIDVWELTLIMKENGLINEVKKDGEHTKYDESGKVLLKSFTKTFINYMSLGFDARVGFNFEQKRSSSRCLNKMIYGWEATKRYLCCRKNIPLTTILDSFQVIDQTKIIPEEHEEEVKPIISNQQNQMIVEEENKEDDKKEKLIQLDSDVPNIDDIDPNDKLLKKRVTIFKTKDSSNSNESGKGKDYLKVGLVGNPIDIICQNINFYMGGTRDIWEHSGSQLGLKVINAKEEEMKNYKNKVISQFNEQRYDDKKIEFFTYESGISMALERVASGQANKIYQGQGPVIMTFKQTPDKTEEAALNKVYLNADGEFFHLLQPKELIVGLNTKICGGQINFLKNITGIK